MFWLNNLQELTYPVLIPNNHMTIEEKLNTVIRLIIFVGIMATLIFNDSRYILFVIIIMIVSIVLYNYQNEKRAQMEKYLNENSLDILDDKHCVKPSKTNPFMNPNIVNIKYSEDEHPHACSIDNSEVQASMKKLFYASVFRETDDIYDKNMLERQFYTVPATTIPNDREKLGNWLYNRGPSCKENNGIQCYNNLFHDLKNSSHY